MIWTGKGTRPRHAAVNARQPNRLALACWAGGGHGERGEPTAGADRGGSASRPPRGGPPSLDYDRGGGPPCAGPGAGAVPRAETPPGPPAGREPTRGGAPV